MATSLLFTGHMIDRPDRTEPRFPATLETAARARIAKAVESYTPSSSNHLQTSQVSSVMGFASGARGGDILFHEECRRHAIDTVIMIPFEPETFIKSSVAIEGIDDGTWPRRFWSLWNTTPPERRHVLSLSRDDEAYAICNTRLLELARRHGRIHLIALWDGKDGDGPGGTADLVAKARMEDDPDVFSPESLRG